MTEFEARVEGHATVEALAQIEGQLENLTAPDAAGTATLDRARAVIGHVSNLVNNADPALVAPSLLAALQTPLANTAAAITAYAAEAGEQWIAQINERLDAVISVVGWPITYVDLGADELRQAAASYRRSAGQLLRSIDQEAQATRALLADLQGEAERVKGEFQVTLDNAAATAKASTDSLEARLSELTQEVTAQKARLDTLTAEYQRQFSADQNTRSTAAADALTKQAAAAEQARNDAAAAYAQLQTELRNSAVSLVADMEAQLERAKTVVNAVGAIAYGGGYGGYADQQRRTANIWAFVGAVTLIVIAIAGMWEVWNGIGSLDISEIVVRAAITIPLFVLAGFAFQQSGRHRENERAARRFELELAAIDPYLALLDDTKRNEIKSDIAKRMFAQPLSQASDDGMASLASKLVDAIKDIATKR